MESSTRKLKANARNAGLSTGPGDTSRTRLNATKHGILSKDVLVRTGDGKENEADFAEFSDRMWEDLSPVGAIEESLAQDMINITWRKRRVIAYESAVLSQQADTAKKDWEERNQVPVDVEGMIRYLRKPELQISELESLFQFDSPGKGTNFDRMLAAIGSLLSKGDGVAEPTTSQGSPFLVARLRIYQAERAVNGSKGEGFK